MEPQAEASAANASSSGSRCIGISDQDPLQQTGGDDHNSDIGNEECGLQRQPRVMKQALPADLENSWLFGGTLLNLIGLKGQVVGKEGAQSGTLELKLESASRSVGKGLQAVLSAQGSSDYNHSGDTKVDGLGRNGAHYRTNIISIKSKSIPSSEIHAF